MRIKNQALINLLGTDTITKDMNISSLKLALDQKYDFEEIRAIQEMFNISNIDIVEKLSYDDFGVEEEFDPFEIEEDSDTKLSKLLKELNPKGIKGISFDWIPENFESKGLEEFHDLEQVVTLDSYNNPIQLFAKTKKQESAVRQDESNDEKIDKASEPSRIDSNEKHLKIGPLEIPNFKDFKKNIKELYTTISSRLKNMFNDTKALGDGAQKDIESHIDDKTEKGLNSWDLENWGTDRKEFSEQRRETVNELIKKTDGKDNEPDKSTEIDVRE